MWAINTTDRFDRWFTSLDDTERASVLAALLVLLIPYIAHYYLLENGVQKMYQQYDKIKQICLRSK